MDAYGNRSSSSTSTIARDDARSWFTSWAWLIECVRKPEPTEPPGSPVKPPLDRMDNATLLAVFIASLLVTVVLLVASIWTGVKRRRKAHLKVVAVTVVSLTISIVLAELYGRRFTFEAGIRDTHLLIAKFTTFFILAPAITGVLSLKRPGPHPWHGKSVVLFLLAVVVTVVTGTMMMLTGEPR